MSKSITDRVGYKQKEGDSYHYFVLPEIYKSEICKGLNYRQVSKYLISAGFLVPDGSGKSQQAKLLPDIGIARIYHFKPDILL